MNTKAQLYRCFDAEGNLLYVGASKNVFQRIVEHKVQSGYWFRDVTRVEIQHFGSRKEALAAEAIAINTENPIHNVAIPYVPGLDHKAAKARQLERCVAAISRSLQTTQS